MRSVESEAAATARGPWFLRFPQQFRRKISQGAYRPEIDGLRFFAILFVIIGHSIERAARFFPSYQRTLEGGPIEPYLQLAPLGVLLFFAISGFILANQALKADAGPLSGAFLKSYFGRRIMRIEPPYFLLLVATWAIIALTHWSPEGTHRFDVEPRSLNVSLVASLVYQHDLIWGTFPRLFPPGWSLEVEVQFYFLAPLLFALWAFTRTGAQRIGTAMVLTAIGVGLALLHLDKLGPLDVKYSLLRYFQYFWAGIMLAYFREPIAERVSRLPAGLSTALGWGGLGVCIALAPPFAAEGLALEATRMLGVQFGLGAMFASTFDKNSGFRAFCAAPWISLIGGACYSIYLIHLQVIHVFAGMVAKFAPSLPLSGVALVFLASTVAVLLLGMIYYVQVERRFMTKNWPLAFREYALQRLGRLSPSPASGPYLVVENAPTSVADGESITRVAASRDPLEAKRRSAAARP